MLGERGKFKNFRQGVATSQTLFVGDFVKNFKKVLDFRVMILPHPALNG